MVRRHPRLSWLPRSAVLTVAVALTGCAGQTPAMQLAKAPAFEPEGQSKCGVRKSQSRPLIVEWPAADRGALEAQKQKGIVAVRYHGCEMEVLRQCEVPGGYGYVPVTPKQDRIRIETEDELYANIPVFAAKFESTLASAGSLGVDMTIVGSFEADRREVKASELAGDCGRATHFISALTTGAFEFTAGGSAEIGGGAQAMGAGAGAKSSAQKELLNRDGYEKACREASREDDAPPEGCGALLRVEVVPIDRSEPAPGPGVPAGVAASPAPTRPERAAPVVGPGVVKLHVDSDEVVQIVRLGAMGAMPYGMNASGAPAMMLRPRELVCTSPCDTWVDGRQGAEFLVTGSGVTETEPFQLQPRQGEVTMRVDTGSVATRTWGVMSTLTGVGLGVSGGLFLGLGLGLESADSSGSSFDYLVYTGAGSLGVGGLLLAIGIPLWVTSDTDYEIAGASLRPTMGEGGTLLWRF